MKKLLLSCLIAFGALVVLPMSVYAMTTRPTVQYPVSDLNASLTAGPGEQYTVNLDWTRPILSNTPFPGSLGWPLILPGFPPPWVPPGEPTPPDVDRSWLRFPGSYALQIRNATAGELAFGPAVDIWFGPIQGDFEGPAVPANLLDLHSQVLSTALPILAPGNVLPLPHSSLFEARIRPRRTAPTFGPPAVPGGEPTFTGWQPVPVVEGGHFVERTAIIMTNIVIDRVVAQGSEILVDIIDPGLLMFDIAEQWHVAWQPSAVPGAIADNPPNETNSGWRRIDNTPGNVPVVGQRGGRQIRRITVPGVALSPGGAINIKIEPVHAGGFLRDPRPPFDYIIIDGRNFTFAATPRDFQFRANEIVISPWLDYIRLNARDIHLVWDQPIGPNRPGAFFYLIQMSGPDPDTAVEVEPRLVTFEGIQFTNARSFPFTLVNDVHYFRLVAIIPDLVGTGYQRLESNILTVLRGVADFYPYIPTIFDANAVSPLLCDGNGYIEPVWFRAFVRYPYTYEEVDLPDELVFGEMFADPNVAFYVYVTDRFDQLGSFDEHGRWNHGTIPTHGEMHVLRVEPGAAMMPIRNADGPNIPSIAYPSQDELNANTPLYRLPVPLTHFAQMVGGSPQLTPLIGNRVYTIMIYAVRTDGGDQMSQPAFFRVYMHPFCDEDIPPEMISSPPLRARALPGTTNIEVEFDVRYLEIAGPFNADAPQGITERWYSAIGVSQAGEVVFGTDALFRPDMAVGMTINDIIREIDREQGTNLWYRMFAVNTRSHTEVNAFLTEVRPRLINWLGQHNATHDFVIRIKDMGSATSLREGRHIYVHTVTMDHMLLSAGATLGDRAETYRANNLTAAGQHNLGAFRMIDPGDINVTGGVGRFIVNQIEAPTAGAPTEFDTSYMIYLMPVQRQIPPGFQAFMPSFVPVTIPAPPTDITPVPTVPVLFPVPEWTTETTVGVRWRLQGHVDELTGIPNQFEWEIRWSEFFVHYYAQGNIIPWYNDDEDAPGIVQRLMDPNNLSDIILVNGIPYIHLRIDRLFPGTNHHIWAFAESAGNPRSAASNPVMIRTLDISPPEPPRSLGPAPLNLINLYIGLNDVDWLANDPRAINVIFLRSFQDLGAEMPSTPRHEEGVGDGVPLNLPLPEFNEVHITRFADLQPNTEIFMRARTIRTITRPAPSGPTTDVFTYELQIADNPGFLDPLILVIAPTEIIDPLDPNARQAFSPWVESRSRTGVTGDDVFGLFRPEQFPMPDRDFEITYDPLTQTLKFRFRTDRIGADGLPDQNADYRFIGRLNTERVTVYTVDMSAYQGLPISIRIIEVPVSIMNAFEERSIILAIETGQLNLQVPPGAFNTSQTRGLSMATRDYFQITLNYNPRNMPTIDVNTSFATIPAHLNVVASSNGRRSNVTAFNNPVGISLPTDGVQNVGLFRSGEGFVGWQDTRGEFSWANMSLNTSTYTPMTFAGIARNAPPIAGPGVGTPAVNQSMQRVLARLTITDLISFDERRVVTVHEFNNVVNAIAQNRTSVTLAAEMSPADVTALTRARFYTPAAGFNRAVATDVLVRLYELRTRQSLTPITPLNSVPGLANAPADLHHNLRKAADIGFITGPFFPNEQLTLGELMNMLDIIIMDSGF